MFAPVRRNAAAAWTLVAGMGVTASAGRGAGPLDGVSSASPVRRDRSLGRPHPRAVGERLAAALRLEATHLVGGAALPQHGIDDTVGDLPFDPAGAIAVALRGTAALSDRFDELRAGNERNREAFADNPPSGGMLRLAVATRAETYDRLDRSLPDHGIEVGHLPTTERAIPLDAPPERGFDVGLVFPSRLMEGGVADARWSIPWVNDREAILTSRNKAEVLARLADAGLPVPETVLVSNPVSRAELVETFERFEPPVVVKPNSTTRGTGVALASDLDSFLGICDYLRLLHEFPATGDRSFLVQEFLPGVRDYRAMVVDGEYVGAVERRGAAGWKHNVHRGASATGTRLSDDRQALVESAADALGIPFLGVDLLATDDRIVVSETNARPTVDDATKYEPNFDRRLADLICACA